MVFFLFFFFLEFGAGLYGYDSLVFLHWEFFGLYALDTITVIGMGHVLGVDGIENCIEAVFLWIAFVGLVLIDIPHYVQQLHTKIARTSNMDRTNEGRNGTV